MGNSAKQNSAAGTRRQRRVVLFVIGALVLAPLLVVITRWPFGGASPAHVPAGDCGFEIVNTYPHDPTAFTQGLVWHEGYLYETTGQYGQSRLRRVQLETGKVEQEHRLGDEFFGEGMTLLGDRIYQVTYRSNTGFVYDAKTFKELKRFRYNGEGWGLTHDGKRLIMTNGTSRVSFLDPETLEVTGSVIAKYKDPVTGKEQPVHSLNELEYIDGEIFANVWTKEWIARIDPATGTVRGWIDLSSLRSLGGVVGGEVLNGIAYDAAGKRLFVTGKNWPKLFEIKLVQKEKKETPAKK